jgi:predicted RNA binding protein YcfA (HicA-like mRNA interferase family)
VKIKKVIKLVEKDGWYLVRTTGSHRHYKHPIKKGIVTIAGHPDMEIAKKTLNCVLKQAGLNREDMDG